MKVGFETILWGIRLDDIKRTLDIIAEAGYQGVEFAQRYDLLGVKDIQELLDLLAERDLALLGFAFGTLEERMQFCGDYRPEYLYVENWDPQVAPSAVKQGFTLALHPRVFKPIRRLSDALHFLKEHPELRFLPDTAHLTIAGDDPVEAIRQAGDRLVAVHLKDWSAQYGRSCHRYAKGFTELGTGDVNLDAVLDELRNINFTGWIVAELDNVRKEPESSVIACAEWLSQRGLLPAPPRKKTRPAGQPRRLAPFPPFQVGKCLPEAEARFLRSVMLASTQQVDTFYRSVAEAFSQLIPCYYVSVWACSPAQDSMGLLAIVPEPPSHLKPPYVLKMSETLSGLAIERQAPVTRFDVRKEYDGRHFAHHALLQEHPITQMVTIPIYNFGNQTYVRLLIGLLPREETLPVTDWELHHLGAAVSAAADSVIARLCSFAAASVNLLAEQWEQVDKFLQKLCGTIQSVVNCESVSIFLVNEWGDKLELAATTGMEWVVPEEEKFYRKGEGLTGRVWERNEPMLTVDARAEREPGREGKSTEIVPTPEQYAFVWVPFVDSEGTVVAVVRCRNKRVTLTTVVPNMFSDDDAAVLDAVGQAAVPHLTVMLDEERRNKALGRMAHELKVPLVAIRGATESMRRTENLPDSIHEELNKIWARANLMRRTFGNADMFRYRRGDVRLQTARTRLVQEVIKPVLQEVEPLLAERGFPADEIHCESLDRFPSLWIDRERFQQVTFNLLSNAIRYSHSDPSCFQVWIIGEEQGGELVIRFRDNGLGIESGTEETIFKQGVRGREAMNKHVAGHGLGLWVVRQIIQAHGGRIEVTRRCKPTEFTVYLPKSLARVPPAATSGVGQRR